MKNYYIVLLNTLVIAMAVVEVMRSIGNFLGLTWWAKVQTSEPNAVYWFGPFLTKRSLKGKLTIFLQDLNYEGIKGISHDSIRCRKVEPLTF